MRKSYQLIIEAALEKARKIKATPAEYREALNEWIEELVEEIAASEATDAKNK